MASKGFCMLAQNGSENYIDCAVTAARSIKRSQAEHSKVCLITTEEIDESYRKEFDYIVEVPWVDHAVDSNHKIENTWKYFWATPFDKTIVVSPDMIVPADLSHWWELFEEKELWFPTRVRNFSGKLMPQRNLYDENPHVQPLYANLFYFRKSDLAAEFFCMLEQVFNNWENMYARHLNDSRPTQNDMSLNYSLAAYLIDAADKVSEPSVTEIPSFVNIYHEGTNDEIYNALNVFLNKEDEFHISNYKQYLPIHYNRKEWFDQYRIFKIYDKKK